MVAMAILGGTTTSAASLTINGTATVANVTRADVGQGFGFTATVTGGTGPFTVELFNRTSGMQQGANVIIGSPGGSNTFSLVAGAAGTFQFNAIATDLGTSAVFSSGANTVVVSPALTAPPTPTAQGASGAYGQTINITSFIPTTGSSTYVYLWLVSYNESSFQADINDTPFNLSYCANTAVGYLQSAGEKATCSFVISNATQVPPGIYNFELQVYDNATTPESTISAPVEVNVGPVSAIPRLQQVYVGQSDPINVYVENNTPPFNSSAGPFTIQAYVNFDASSSTTAAQANQNTTVNVIFGGPGDFTVSISATNSSGKSASTPNFLISAIAAPRASAPTSNITSPTPLQPFQLSTVISGGIGPFTANLVAANGILMDSITSINLVGGGTTPISFPALSLPAGDYAFNVVVNDPGDGLPFLFNSSSLAITVATYQSNNNGGGGGNNGGGGGGAGGGGGGSNLPTVLHEGSCYDLYNLTQKSLVNFYLNNSPISVRVNYITPTGGGITVNDTSYNVTPSVIERLFENRGYNYTAEMSDLSYLPVEDTFSLAVCSSPTSLTLNSPPSYNQTVTSQASKVSALVAAINNLTVTNNTQNNTITTTAALSGWPGNLTVVTTAGTPRPKLHIGQPSSTAIRVPAPSGYGYLIVMLNLTVNATASANVLATLSYGCLNNPADLEPFILKNGSWVEIGTFSINKISCTISFTVPKDPTVAIFSSAVPFTTTTAQTTTSILPLTAGRTSSLPPEPSGGQIDAYYILRTAINIIGMSIVVMVMAIMYVHRRPSYKDVRQSSDQAIAPMAAETTNWPSDEQNMQQPAEEAQGVSLPGNRPFPILSDNTLNSFSSIPNSVV